MNCPNCGTEVRGAFCTNCGTRVPSAPGGQPAPRDVDSTAVLRQDDLANFAASHPEAASSPSESPAAGAESGPAAVPGSGPSWTQSPSSSGDATTPGWSSTPAWGTSQGGAESPPPGQSWSTSPQASQPGSGDAASNFGAGSGSAGAAPAGSTGGYGGTSYNTSGSAGFGTNWDGPQVTPQGLAGGPFGGGPAAASMRAMTLGDIISGAFSIVQTHLFQFLGVAGAYAIGMFVGFIALGFLVFASISAGIASGSVGTSIFTFLVGLLIFAVVGAVASAIAACAFIRIATGNESLEGGDIVAGTIATLQRAWAASPNLLIAYFILFGAYIGTYVVLFLLSVVGLGFLVGLLGLAAVVGWVWIGVSIAFFAQAIVIDGASPVDAFMESRQLVAGAWWRTFGYLLVAGLIGMGIAIVGGIVIGILGVILSHIPILGGLVISLLYAAVEAVIYAYFVTFATLMFFDLKARKSGVTVPASAPAY